MKSRAHFVCCWPGRRGSACRPPGGTEIAPVRVLAATAAIGSLLACGTATAAAPEYKLSLGLDCSSGRYGQAELVNICMVPYSLQVLSDRYELKLSVPYYDVRAEAGSGTRGVGDASFYAARTVLEEALGLDAIELNLKVKARNGSSARGLGTGRTAYNLGFGLTKLAGTQHLVLAYGGLTARSRPGSEIGGFAVVWYKYLASPRVRIGLLYENNEVGYAKRIETFAVMPELVVGGGWTLKPFVYVGLNGFAPDKGIGMVGSYSLR